jgi:thiosulfate/3-mercaptopyruvate sulfurtransferase
LLAGCAPIAPPLVAPAPAATTVVEAEIAEYAHPEALVTTAWLADHLNDANLRIVDVRRKDVAAYEAEHIPGAIHADLIQDLMSPQDAVISRVPPAEVFSATMQRLGIDNDTTVVVYDPAGGYMGAARLWWILRYYGHDDVKLLNGGLAKWKLEGRQLEQGNITPPAGTFTAGAPRPEWRAEADQVSTAIADPQFLLVDALPAGMFTGEAKHSEPIRDGHIPTARNLPAPGLIDVESTALLPREALAQKWATLTPQAEQQAIVYCEGGVFSAFDFFVLYQLGHEKIRLYEASLREWGVDPAYPMESGLGR